jgi:hypothetical protein
MESSVILPNTPHVVAEDFDNEIIIVNLYNGNYYSLRDSAAVIWKLIMQKPLYSDLLSQTARTYGVTESEISEPLEKFIRHLQQDHMIRTEDANGHAAQQLNLPVVDKKFEAPLLEAYSDMQDLLILDPIHEVDEEKGWPEKK